MNIIKKYKNGRGYTIIETLIAMSIFITVATLGVHAFINALGAQRTIIMEQAVAQNASFALEFMSRQVRTAIPSPDGDCVAENDTFIQPDLLRFLNDSGQCLHFRRREFPASSGKFIIEYTSDYLATPREYIPLVSSEVVSIDDFSVIIEGRQAPGSNPGDNQQPQVTIIIEARGIPQTPKDPQNVLLRAQTSVSTRLLDI